eukprot:737712-Rhodomonas_salina.2
MVAVLEDMRAYKFLRSVSVSSYALMVWRSEYSGAGLRGTDVVYDTTVRCEGMVLLYGTKVWYYMVLPAPILRAHSSSTSRYKTRPTALLPYEISRAHIDHQMSYCPLLLL